jgi:PilZ domain
MAPSSRLRLQDTEVVSTLKECCALNLQAAVTTVEPGNSARAHFISVGVNGVALDLDDAMPPGLRPASACVVTYSMNGKVFLFLSRLGDCSQREASGPVRMTLDLPDNIALADLRGAVRVPVAEECGLQVQVEVSMYATDRSKVLDISKSGILLEYEPGATPDMAEGDIAKICLKLGEQVAEYTAELRHLEGGRCGFMFIEPDEPIDAVQQEEALQDILEDVDGHTARRYLGKDHS